MLRFHSVLWMSCSNLGWEEKQEGSYSSSSKMSKDSLDLNNKTLYSWHIYLSNTVSTFLSFPFRNIHKVKKKKLSTIQRTFCPLPFESTDLRPYCPQILFPTDKDSLLYNHDATVKIRQLTLMHGCCLSLRLYSRSANCPNAVFSSNGFRNTHCTKLSCLCRLPLPETSPRSLFDVHDLDAFELSCNLSLHLGFASVSLGLYSGYTTLAGIS